MSRVFPGSKELNLANLVSFVAANLGLENRLRLALTNCDTACRNKVRCAHSSTLTFFLNTSRIIFKLRKTICNIASLNLILISLLSLELLY
jgi:hypothetical protein